MGLVDGQRILITGASQGLGAGIAHTLAAEGAATLLLTARSLPRGTAVAAALRAAHPAMDVTFLPADLAVPADVEAVVRAADAAAITCHGRSWSARSPSTLPRPSSSRRAPSAGGRRTGTSGGGL